MSIGQRIKERRNDIGITRDELGKLIGVSGSAVANYENDISVPKTEVFYKLFDALKCDANFLYQDFINGIYDYDMTLAEQRFFKSLRALDSYGKDALSAIMQAETDRVKAQNTQLKSPTRYIDFFYMPVSAGAGIDPGDGYSEPIEIPLTDVTARASYALRVSGDSMEPDYHTGDLLLINSKPAEDGELGIFIYQNEGFFKKLVKNRLVSLNPNYPPKEISDIDAFYNKGTVIGKL